MLATRCLYRKAAPHWPRGLSALAALFTLVVMSNTAAALPPPSGHLVVTGSTALADLTTLWAEAFAEHDPAVTLTVADPGSAVGFEALLSGTAEAVLVSTPLREKQRRRFMERYGYPPSVEPVALDGVAVYVNDLNPLRQITLPELDAIYSSTLRCGLQHSIRRWDALGVTGPLAKQAIVTVGLTDDSGAYYLFRQIALCGGDFRDDFQAMAGPSDMQAAVDSEPAAMGFSSNALRAAGLRPLAIARQPGEAAVAPDAATIRSGRYPLSRTLSIAYNLPPGREPGPALRAFLDFARSPEGQSIARKAGYVPLRARP